MFADAVDTLLRDSVTPEMLSAAERGPMPAALWAVVEENGLPLAAAPEVGAGWHECRPIAQFAGYHAAPVPLAETLAVNWLLGRNGIERVSGPASLGVCTDALLRDGRFSGTVAGMPWGGEVAHVLVGCRDATLLLAVAGAAVTLERNIAGEPRDTLRFASAVPIRQFDATEAVRIAGAMVRTAQIAGGLMRLCELCTDHVQQRVQFGRPIAAFQAVQHNIARLAEQAALASAAAGAAFACDDPRDAVFATAAAKQVASEAAGEGAAIAHGLVGAIGFTQDYILHRITRRLLAWRAEFGSARVWADAIGNAACATAPADFWPSLVRGDLVL